MGSHPKWDTGSALHKAGAVSRNGCDPMVGHGLSRLGVGEPDVEAGFAGGVGGEAVGEAVAQQHFAYQQ